MIPRPLKFETPPFAARGYSLIEVLVAAAILMIGVAATASMALTITTQAEANTVISRMLNLQEQAARLFQLGLDPIDITTVLPRDPAQISLTLPRSTNSVVGIGSIEQIRCTITFKSNFEALPVTVTPETWSGGDPSALRTSVITAVRASIR